MWELESVILKQNENHPTLFKTLFHPTFECMVEMNKIEYCFMKLDLNFENL
jgi:hypothetical protein